jgi:hypothetical protein
MNKTLDNFDSSASGAVAAVSLDSVTARWTRLGAMFNVTASTEDVIDLERLLLDTARGATANTRLLVMAVTWLSRHGNAVAKHRLTRLVRFELEVKHRATLGLILDLARVADRRLNGTRFNAAIEACAEDLTAMSRPLSDVENRSATLRRLAESRASVESRRWGRWIESFDLKHDALRPAAWVMRHNPTLYERSLANGDLTASVLAELATTGGRAASESTLAQACAASRSAIRTALATLQRAGRVAILSGARSHAVQLLPPPGQAA